MTFDGSPRDTRHGVGGFPKLPERRLRTRRESILLIVAALVPVVVIVAGVVAVAIAIG